MKVIFKNSILLGFITIFVLLSCDNRSDEQKWEGAIQAFIYEHEEEFYNYRALNFQKIDQAFLEGQEVIQRSLLTLQDTTQRKVRELHLANLSEEAEKLAPFTQTLSIDQLDDLLKVRAQIDLHLRSKDLSSNYLETLSEEQNTIEFLDQVLHHFNLSVHSLDLGSNSVIYHHEFLMDGEERSGVFEVDRGSYSVTSFKLVS